MRRSLTLAERYAIIVLIVFVGRLIVSLLPKNETVNAKTAESSVEIYAVEETETTNELKHGYHAEDGFIRQYKDDDVYWEWQIDDITNDAKIMAMNELMDYFAVQDGSNVWLVNGREDIQLFSSNGWLIQYPFYDGSAYGCLFVEDSNLMFRRLYPFSDYDDTVILQEGGVESVVAPGVFLMNGEYYAFTIDRDTLGDGVVYHEPNFVRLGRNRIIERDINRLNAGEMNRSEFYEKHGI